MATVAPSSDRILTNPTHRETAELFQQLSLDQTKTSEITEPTKKPSVNSKDATKGQIQSYDCSITPDYYDPATGYPRSYPPAYYYGNYEGMANDWDDYSRSANQEGVEMPPAMYGDGSLMYGYGYGYPYGPYSPAGSPVPTMGPDGLLYGSQQYQYPTPYFQPLNPSSVPYSPTPAAMPKGDIPIAAAPTEKAPLSVEAASGNINGIGKFGIQGNNGSAPTKQTYVDSQFGSNVSNGRGALPGGYPASAYPDPRYGFTGSTSPVPWSDSQLYSDGAQSKPISTSTVSHMSHASNTQVSRNHNYRPNSHLMGYQPSQMSTMGAANGYFNGLYPNNKLYGQYGSNFRSGFGFGYNGYDSRTGGRGWYSGDSKYKPRGRYLGNDMDGMNELNRGPRAKNTKNLKAFAPLPFPVKTENTPSNETKDDEKDKLNAVIPDREQYNKADFPEAYSDAKFFIIKSYSEDDVHKSIKYNVWASTPNGNKKLDEAYKESQQKPSSCPVFLFFSVNTSGQFVGVAEMAGPVDFDKNFEYWQQDKWNGCFPVKWHIVKDVSNSLLKHITLEYNENKPVTNSRDTQEVKLEQGLQMLKIFKENASKTCILDDFYFYEARQRAIQDKKAKQQQFQKQVAEKASDGKKEAADGESKSLKSSSDAPSSDSSKENTEVAAASASASASAAESKGDVKPLHNDTVVAESGDGAK